MFEYHDHLTATHPYSSKWWEWPLDLVPVAYFYQDHRANQQDPKGCCVYEITSLPNPVNSLVRFAVRSVRRSARLARTQQGLRADRPDVLSAVAAMDALAANYVRLPFLRRYSADLSVQRDRVAAHMASGRKAQCRGTRAVGRRSRGRRVRRPCGRRRSSISIRFSPHIRLRGMPGTQRMWIGPTGSSGPG